MIEPHFQKEGILVDAEQILGPSAHYIRPGEALGQEFLVVTLRIPGFEGLDGLDGGGEQTGVLEWSGVY